MPSIDDVKEIVGDDVRAKRRFDARDWSYLAEYVIGEYERRKQNRSDKERHWKEIDRQIAMEPDQRSKQIVNAQGQLELDLGRFWMSEIEPPLQAQALEVLVADARRMCFPDNGPWFKAHSETTDEYLKRAEEEVHILGDENDLPSAINQDNADKLVEGYLSHLFRQCDLPSRIDRCNAEAFKYGTGVGRARMETKNVYLFEARGVRTEKQRVPVIVPASIKQTYLDDPMPSMHSAQVLGPAHIAEDWIRLENLKLAANAGSSDPKNPDGGWMPKNIATLEAQDNGYVQILEMEGDIVVPRKTVRSVVIPGAIVTVALGAAGKNGGNPTTAVVRFRFRRYPFSSYLLFPYHHEDSSGAYATSPLMKGRPLQIAAAQALNRLMDSAALKNEPPVGYDRNEMSFGQTGGPRIHPGAQWETVDGVTVYDKIGGDPAALAGVYQNLVAMYAELTGVLPARLGAQTVSHTTAFAKDAELQRGATRTVNYVARTGHGPITQWLDMAYRMGRDSMSGPLSFFIDAYGGFVETTRAGLPAQSSFDWFGAGGPAEEQQLRQERINAAQLALQIDTLAVQLGREPTLNLEALITQVLREGKWNDVDTIISSSGASRETQAGPGVSAAPEGGGGAAAATLQAIQGGVG